MITHLLFDVDNTLYPASSGVLQAIDQKINHFVSDYLDVDIIRANELRKEFLLEYGTTLNWLLSAYGLGNEQEYLDFIHPEDLSPYISENEDLRTMLKNLPQQKGILTNSPKEHTARVLSALGIEDCFNFILDLKDNNFKGKPYESAYIRALSLSGSNAGNTLFLDDVPAYLSAFEDLGGHGVLIDENGNHPQSARPVLSKIEELPELLKKYDS